MRKKIGFVIDPIELLKPAKDTSVALMREAQSRGWDVYYLTLADLELNCGKAAGFLRPLHITTHPDVWYEAGEGHWGGLDELDVILMRKDPPFDMEYVMATYILEHAEQQGVLVLNSPSALRDANEKVYTSWFPDCCPPGLLTRSKKRIRAFAGVHGDLVLKPTCKMGGRSVFVVREGDPNTNVIIEEMTNDGTQFVFAQKYVPAIKESGDKRILLINGTPVEQGIARIPGNDDHRGNLAAGAQPTGFLLSERDRWLCDQIGPVLREKKLFFVGIDVIGDYVTEINVTSPTGMCEIQKAFGVSVPAIFFDALPF